MSGETRESVSGWTVDTLSAHFSQRFEDHEARDAERHAADRALVTEAQQAMREAVAKAERATELRFESVNEFRKTLTEQTATFLTRFAFEEFQKAYSQAHNDLVRRVEVNAAEIVADRAARGGGKEVKSEARANVAMLIAVGGAIFSIVIIGAQLLRPASDPPPKIPPGYVLMPAPTPAAK